MQIPTKTNTNIDETDNWVQLLYYEAPESVIKTVRLGEITWRQYVECEAERINNIPGRQAIVTENGRGEMALFVNNVGRKPEDH